LGAAGCRGQSADLNDPACTPNPSRKSALMIDTHGGYHQFGKETGERLTYRRIGEGAHA
jgi:hypothetical protein